MPGVVEFSYTSPKFRWLYPENSVGKKHIIFRGGRASTKSWGVAQAIVDHCRTYEGFRVLCCREIQNSIADSSKKLLDDTISRLGLSSEFTSTNTYIQHKGTKATIKFAGLSGNTESIKSMEGIDFVWCEEAQSLSQETLDVLVPTIRKAGSKIVYTYNPDLPTTPVETIPRRYPDTTVVEHINYLEVVDYLPESLVHEAEADKADNIDRYNWIWLGQYRAQSADTFIPLKLLMESIGRPFTRTNDGVVGGFDVGLFHDSCVLCVRQGPNVIELKEWKNFNWDNPDELDNLVEQIVGYVNRYGMRKLAVDANGQGAGVYLKLKKALGDIVVGIMPGAAAKDKKKYCKVSDESWGRIRDWLPKGSLPRQHEQMLISDLTNRKFFYDSKGRYQLESKKQYLQRGFPSPNFADAIGYSLLVNCASGEYEWWQKEAGRVTAARIMQGRRDYPSDWMGI